MSFIEQAKRNFNTSIIKVENSKYYYTASCSRQLQLQDFIRYCKGNRGFVPPSKRVKFVSKIMYSSIKQLYSIKMFSLEELV